MKYIIVYNKSWDIYHVVQFGEPHTLCGADPSACIKVIQDFSTVLKEKVLANKRICTKCRDLYNQEVSDAGSK